MKNNTRRLRVLFLAGCWYPDEDRPVEGIFIQRHARAAAQRHDITVLHLAGREDGPKNPVVHRDRSGDVVQYHVRFGVMPTSTGGARHSQAAYFRAAGAGLRGILGREKDFDVLHIHVVPSPAALVPVFFHFRGRPFLLTEHWSGYLPASGVRLSPARRLYTRFLTRRAAVVTTVSEAHARAMQAAGFTGRYRVVPNVVDPEVFHPAGRVSGRPFRFIVVASLRPEKNVPGIIRVFRGISDPAFDAVLHLIGDGPLRKQAETAAGDDPRIVFFGQLPGDGVAQRLRQGDALVLFSSFENSPCVIGEAFASGIPVIAPEIGGIPEHLGPARGMLIPPGDTIALHDAMKQVATRERPWDVDALRRYAISHFSPEKISVAFDEEYSRASGMVPGGESGSGVPTGEGWPRR